jgi:hypothetical protein
LPHFQHILSYLETPRFIEAFSSQELAQGVESLLSFSRFSRPDWKSKALAVGDRILDVGLGDPQLLARLMLRRKVLSDIYPGKISTGPDNMNTIIYSCIVPVDPRSNAYFGGVLLSNAQEMMDSGNLSDARSELQRFQPLNVERPSTQERGVMNVIKFCQGKISRFEGYFHESEQYLTQLLGAKPLYSETLSKVTSHLIAVHCELGNITTAMKLIENEMDDPNYHTWLHSGKGRRLRLVTAEMHLTNGLWIVAKMIDRTPISPGRSFGFRWKKRKKSIVNSGRLTQRSWTLARYPNHTVSVLRPGWQ